jgi:hypothetical protein
MYLEYCTLYGSFQVGSQLPNSSSPQNVGTQPIEQIINFDESRMQNQRTD